MPCYVMLGRREQGKSTLAYHMARKVPARAIFDPRGIFQHVPSGRLDDDDDLEPAWRALAAGRVSEIVYTPDSAIEPAFAEWMRYVQAWQRGQRGRRLAVVLDEASLLPLEDEGFRSVLRTSPRASFDLLLTSHRPVDLPVIVRSLADHWCVFATKEPRDLAVLAERCAASVADVVTRLGPREFARWADQGGARPGDGRLTLHRDPLVWFVPLEDVPVEVPLLSFRNAA